MSYARIILGAVSVACLGAGAFAFLVGLGIVDLTLSGAVKSALLFDKTGLTFLIIGLGFWMLREGLGHYLSLRAQRAEVSKSKDLILSLALQSPSEDSPAPFSKSLLGLAFAEDSAKDPLRAVIANISKVVQYGGQPPVEAELDEVQNRLDRCSVGHWIRILTVLGFMGTLVGFMLILSGVGRGQLEEPGQLGSVLSSAIASFGVAAYTTLAGGFFGLVAFLLDERLSERANSLRQEIREVILLHVMPILENELDHRVMSQAKTRRLSSAVGIMLGLYRQLEQLSNDMKEVPNNMLNVVVQLHTIIDPLRASLDSLEDSVARLNETELDIKQLTETIYGRVPANSDSRQVSSSTGNQIGKISRGRR